MKKLFKTIFVILMALFIVSCGNTAGNNPENKEEPKKEEPKETFDINKLSYKIILDDKALMQEEITNKEFTDEIARFELNNDYYIIARSSSIFSSGQKFYVEYDGKEINNNFDGDLKYQEGYLVDGLTNGSELYLESIYNNTDYSRGSWNSAYFAKFIKNGPITAADLKNVLNSYISSNNKFALNNKCEIYISSEETKKVYFIFFPYNLISLYESVMVDNQNNIIMVPWETDRSTLNDEDLFILQDDSTINNLKLKCEKINKTMSFTPDWDYISKTGSHNAHKNVYYINEDGSYRLPWYDIINQKYEIEEGNNLHPYPDYQANKITKTSYPKTLIGENIKDLTFNIDIFTGKITCVQSSGKGIGL